MLYSALLWQQDSACEINCSLYKERQKIIWSPPGASCFPFLIYKVVGIFPFLLCTLVNISFLLHNQLWSGAHQRKREKVCVKIFIIILMECRVKWSKLWENEIQGNNMNITLPRIADTQCWKIKITCWWSCISKGTSLSFWVFTMFKQFAYSSLIYLYWIELIQPPGNVLGLVTAKTEVFVNTFGKESFCGLKAEEVLRIANNKVIKSGGLQMQAERRHWEKSALPERCLAQDH